MDNEFLAALSQLIKERLTRDGIGAELYEETYTIGLYDDTSSPTCGTFEIMNNSIIYTSDLDMEADRTFQFDPTDPSFDPNKLINKIMVVTRGFIWHPGDNDAKSR
jgi:hypothetical protein